jgi:hypothetical protein
MPSLHIVERAPELAQNGSCRTVIEIRRILCEERYEQVDQYSLGANSRRSLRNLSTAQEKTLRLKYEE